MNANPERDRRWLGGALALASLALVGLGALGPAAGAQEATPVAGGGTDFYAPPTTIVVDGRGTVSVEPDTASVVIGVDVLEDDLAETQTAATEQATAIIEAVRAAGVADEDVQTANYSVNILRDFDDQGNPGPITGYQVSNQINVTIRDLDALGTILDDAVAAGANNIYGVSLYVEDTVAAASQARTQAMADAQRKAEELASAAGLTITRVAAINESFAPPPQPLPLGGVADVALARQEAAPVPIETGTTEIVVQVQVTYEAR